MMRAIECSRVTEVVSKSGRFRAIYHFPEFYQYLAISLDEPIYNQHVLPFNMIFLAYDLNVISTCTYPMSIDNVFVPNLENQGRGRYCMMCLNNKMYTQSIATVMYMRKNIIRVLQQCADEQKRLSRANVICSLQNKCEADYDYIITYETHSALAYAMLAYVDLIADIVEIIKNYIVLSSIKTIF